MCCPPPTPAARTLSWTAWPRSVAATQLPPWSLLAALFPHLPLLWCAHSPAPTPHPLVFRAGQVFYSVAEVAFGAKVATVPPAPGASATPAVDPETATQDKFMSEVVHPDVQALLYSSKRTPAADRLVFNDILVRGALGVLGSWG
jgi:hypothetical protein